MMEQALLPADLRPTDVITLVGHWMIVTRDGHELRRINLIPISTPVTRLVLGPVNNLKYIVWERRMPGVAATCSEVRVNTGTGATDFFWSDGSSNTVGAWTDLADVADQFDSDNTLMKKYIMALAYRSSPDGANRTTQVGAMAACDLNSAEHIVYARGS